MIVAAVVHGRTLWYLTRGTGVVSLLLLTASVVLGIGVVRAWSTTRWPRFATAALHRTLTLLAICFVAVHVLTTVVDAYAPVRLVDAFVPFVSPYRPIWLGLGAVAFDLLLALVATSLLRLRLGFRVWRLVHLLAYVCWPVAVAHALGTGSDARFGWLAIVAGGCLLAVLGAVGLRTLLGTTLPRRVRLGGALAAVAVTVLLAAWYTGGPLQPGWARRAGTPPSLLRRPATVRVAARTTVAAPVRLPSSFTAKIAGSIDQQNGGNETTVVIRGKLAGHVRGAFRIDLRGVPLQDGVAMTASGVSFVPAGPGDVYLGSVTGLEGTSVNATVRAAGGRRLHLRFHLQIDAGRRAVGGTVSGVAA